MSQKDESEVLDDLFGASDNENYNLNTQNDPRGIDKEHSDEESDSLEEEIIEKKPKKTQKSKSKKEDSNEDSAELDGN